MWRPPAKVGRLFSHLSLFLINLVDGRERRKKGRGEERKREEKMTSTINIL
jgi:hypothetical protein